MDQTMQCSKCKGDAVIFQPYSGQHLCQEHLTLDIETKVKRIIRQYHWMRPGDHIAIAMGGTAADNALLLFFRNLTRLRHDVTVSVIPMVGERSDFLSVAQEQGITRIALSTTLETTSVSILADILRGDLERCTGAGPALSGTPLIITPFCRIPAEEIAAYAGIHDVEGTIPDPNDGDPLFLEVQLLLTAYSERHPAAPHAIQNLCDTLRHTVRHGPGTYGADTDGGELL
jgi:hypothetical protein